jgi:soluble lytic murein transglycosylase-like protein
VKAETSFEMGSALENRHGSRDGASRGGTTMLLLAVCACFGVATPAQADVIEVDPSGAAKTFTGANVFTRNGAIAIEIDTAVPAVRASRSASVAAILAPAPLAAIMRQAAARYSLDVSLIDAVAHQESRYRYNAISPRGALGIMQLMPGTARMLGVDPFDTVQNIHGGAAYLRMMLDRYNQDERLALAAYNAGPGAVDRYGGIPPFAETRAYVAAIQRGLQQRRMMAPAPVAPTLNVPAPQFGQPATSRPPEVLAIGME